MYDQLLHLNEKEIERNMMLNLKHVVAQKKWTHKRLAERSGLSLSTIGNLMRLQTSTNRLNLMNAMKLCHALQVVNVDDLLTPVEEFRLWTF